MFNDTFDNISVISWQSVLLVKEPGVPGEHLAWAGFELTILVVIGTDCIDSCESNYHMITTMIVPMTGLIWLIDIFIVDNPWEIATRSSPLIIIVCKKIPFFFKNCVCNLIGYKNSSLEQIKMFKNDSWIIHDYTDFSSSTVISGEPSEHVKPLVYRRWTCTEPDTIFQVRLTTEIK